MSTRRRTKLKAAETQQLIGINEARKATAETTSVNQKQEADKKHKERQQQQKAEELPTHILIGILSRLPVKTLLNLRLVCKDWLSLISEPYFAYLHLSKSRLGLLFVPCDYSPKLNLVDLPISPFSFDDRKDMITTINLPKTPNIAYSIINSCNGLLCLIGPDRGRAVCICNPLLGELVRLPNCPSGRDVGRYYCAFGFSPKTTQYKVIRSFRLSYEPETDGGTYGAEIYTLGEGSWRSMGTVPTMVCNFFVNAFLHGSLHWISPLGVDLIIYSFDFGSEQFRVVPKPPSEFGGAEEYWSDYIYVGVLQGCLSICDLREAGRAKVWVMKDYGVKESWSKDFVIEDLVFSVSCEPIMVPDDEQKLLIARRDGCPLKVLNIASKCPRNMDTFQGSHNFIWVSDLGPKCMRDAHAFRRSSTYCIAHVPSLLSLRDVAKGECYENSYMKETGSSSCING